MASEQGGKGAVVASSGKISDSMCAPQYAESLKCLVDNPADKSKCEEFFTNYKACRKVERAKRLEENKRKKAFF